MGVVDKILAYLYRKQFPGCGKLAAYVKRHDAFPVLKTRTMHNLIFNADPKSWMDTCILRTGYYEPAVLECIMTHIETNGVFWDVGANAGIHSLTIKHLLPKVEVFAFEPSPTTFTRLHINAKQNNLDLSLWCLPLADQGRYANLSVMDTGNNGLTTLKPQPNLNYSAQMQCWCDTGDSLLEKGRVKAPTFIKIDVEGFEYEVFLGMNTILANTRLKHIILEAPSDLLTSTAMPPNPIVPLLTEYGFQLVKIEGEEYNYLASRK